MMNKPKQSFKFNQKNSNEMRDISTALYLHLLNRMHVIVFLISWMDIDDIWKLS